MEFTIKTKIKASAKAVYTAWLNSEQHSKMTGGEAHISDIVGETFTAWDGYISGKNLLLEPFTKIVQVWRSRDFVPEDEDSILDITLSENYGFTTLTLYHSDLPENGETYIQGWEEHYFQPMKTFFDV